MSYARMRTLVLMAIDSSIILGCIIVAYLFRYNADLTSAEIQQAALFSGIAIVIGLIVLYNYGLYRRAWQFASIGEVVLIFKSVTIAILLSYTITSLIIPGRIPIAIGFRTYELCLLVIGGSRFMLRIIKDNYIKPSNKQRQSLIIGAGQCGVIVYRELKMNAASNQEAIGFIDDDPRKWGQEVFGLLVIGGREHIINICNEQKIDDIIIALPSASRTQISDIIAICKQTNAKLKMVPQISELLEGKVELSMLRDVGVEDLLGREPVVLENDGIDEYVTNKVVLVTGAGGSIGSELCRQILHFKPSKLLLLGHGENSIYQIHRELKDKVEHLVPIIADVQDRKRMEQVFKQHKPHVVFHAAAHKHVPLMEENPSESIKNNVFGTRNVAECSDIYGAERFVLISTDKAVNPTSIMGTTKRIAEMFIQCLAKQSRTKFSAVRFGNVLGSRGSVIPLFKEQIAAGGPVTVTHPEMVRYFMTIPEASRLVIQAGAYANGGEIFILDMGEPVKIADLARDLIRLSGYEPEVDIKIQYSGIRQGEKLYEELLLKEEGMTDTQHSRIFIGRPASFNREDIELELRRLERILGEDRTIIQELLSRIVPTYVTEKREDTRVLVTSS
ncbi:polysaccharide biosynthesis protein [Paenibacillus endoradicis]|uniref:polysaccharide biosynthesis protein n=1 Tax=Paenibacillus endoradicis TaxID=2972487 RepID=UPI002158CBA2|nr:nucleoside-diphosphate sugar epimerase/dehydratase [Paenibacillus endoradicis]MCR8660653.1 polysaccharide biosynthesis protein [Paenibacillus endoradicis]